jgi:hypothetical protein
LSNWVCPYCRHAQAATEARFSVGSIYLNVAGARVGEAGLKHTVYVCANAECQELILSVDLVKYFTAGSGKVFQVTPLKIIETWKLLPSSSSKPQPDVIPLPLREDYYESCSIKELSPKASAALSRRCLQGMIRDFCGIAKGTLDKEITALRTAVTDGNAPKGVTEESVDAIDHVRTVGNIGAHMEKDINLIVEVEAGEAQVLLELVESLFEEWYVARDKRQKRFAAVQTVAEQKREAIAELRAAGPAKMPDPPKS